MKKILIVCILLIFLVPSVMADALFSAEVLDTTGIPCDGIGRSIWWQNTLGEIKILKCYLWSGFTTGFRGDADARVYCQRAYDVLLAINQWDHYTDPVLPHHGRVFNFAPNFVAMNPGEHLRLDFWTSPHNGMFQHHYAIIWYIYG